MFVPAFSLASLALLGVVMARKRRVPSRLRIATDTLNATLLLISGIMLAIFLGITNCNNMVRKIPALLQLQAYTEQAAARCQVKFHYQSVGNREPSHQYRHHEPYDAMLWL
jgi:uncharacterized membrane protein SirB2